MWGFAATNSCFFNKNKFNMQTLILNQIKSPVIALKMILYILTIKTMPQ